MPDPKHVIVAETTRRPNATPQPLLGATFVIGAAAMVQLPAAGAPEIAFAGRSNAGKSSAINALATRTRLAFASRTPGRTQQINLFALRSGALIADLPGYGYAAVAKELKASWHQFLWEYLTRRETLVALILVIDSRHGLKDGDVALLQAFLPSGRPVRVLATKADKLGTAAQRTALVNIATQLGTAFPAGTPNVAVQLFSAATRQGVAEANAAIQEWVPAAPSA